VRKIAIFLAMISIFMTGCFLALDSGELPEDPADSAPEVENPIGDVRIAEGGGCPRAVVTSGLGLAWKWLNHRISLWQVAPNWNDCPTEYFNGAELQAGYVGGNWSTGQTATDAPAVEYRYFAVDGEGSAAFCSVEVELYIQTPADYAEGTVEIALDQCGLEGYDDYAAFINGLLFATDIEQLDPDYPTNYDPALGYTSRGIGAAVEKVEVREDSAKITVSARFELGPADRGDMNEAIEHARTKATVTLLLVGLREAAVTTVERGYELTYDPPRPLFQQKYDHATPEQRRVKIEGDPGFSTAFLGVEGFNLALFGSVEKGDYIRELSVQAELLSYDTATGAAVVDLDGYASNASLLTYEIMETDFEARLALVQLPGGKAEAGQVKRQFEVGQTTIPLQ
jgi:hypothetical protein